MSGCLLFLASDSQHLVPLFPTLTVAQRTTHPCYQMSKRCCSPMGWCYATLWTSHPTPVASPWTSSSRQLPFPVMRRVQLFAQSRHYVASSWLLTTCVALATSQALSSTGPDPTSTMPRVRDWPAVLSSCHPSLATQHQSVLALNSHPCPDIPGRTSVLDTLFGALTQVPVEGASLHTRRRSTATLNTPRQRQPLWWNDACFHALVARNGSWRDPSLRFFSGPSPSPHIAPAVPQHSSFLQVLQPERMVQFRALSLSHR